MERFEIACGAESITIRVNAMHRIAPSEKDTAAATLENRLWDVAEQAVPAPHVAEPESRGAHPEGLLGLVFLRFAEVRFAAQHARPENVSAGFAIPA